nr:exodeoxyribonuclease VII small subunit [uncultured Sellimonas sp.]
MELNELFEKLDAIQKRMQSEELSLEDSFRYYAEAMELLKECDKKIDAVEKKVLIIDENGEEHEFK